MSAVSLLGGHNLHIASAAELTDSRWNFDNNVGYVLGNHDNRNMTFSSYLSQASTTTYSRASIAYRSNTASNLLNSPKNKDWHYEAGWHWDAENELPTAGSPVTWVRAAYSPILTRYYEKIVVALSGDGYLDAYVWTGSSWSVTNNIGFVGSNVTGYRPFDVTYERARGAALLVYGIQSADPVKDLAYKIWNGSGWSAEYYITDTIAYEGQYWWIDLASKPIVDSNEIAMVTINNYGSTGYIYSWIWDGNAWGNSAQMGNQPNKARESIAVAYESLSGYAMVVYGDASSRYFYSKRWLGNGWEASTRNAISLGTHGPGWATFKSDPSSNRLMLLTVTEDRYLYTSDWNGDSTTWTAHSSHDTAVDTNAQRCADGDWESTGSKYLMSWGTTSGRLHYRTWTTSGWSSSSNINAAGTHRWVQVRRNPRSVSGDIRILVSMLNSNYDLGTATWSGSALTNMGDATITADTTVYTYECFDLRWRTFGDPAEFTSEVEFMGSSNTETWVQLIWSVSSSWTIASVTVTIQLYNYNGGSYPSSGDGYLSYASSATANTDETKTQTIAVNPQNFRDATGNWKIKIKGVKSIGTQFNFKVDWIEYKPTSAAPMPYNPSGYSLSGATTLVSTGDSDWYYMRDLSAPLVGTVTVAGSSKYWRSDRTGADRYSTSPIPAGTTWTVFLSWQSKSSGTYTITFYVYTSQGNTVQTQIATGVVTLPIATGVGTTSVTVQQTSDITPAQTPYDITLQLSPIGDPQLVLKTGNGGSYLDHRAPTIISVTSRVISATNCGTSCSSGNNLTGSPPAINVNTEYWFSTVVSDSSGLTDIDNVQIYLYKTGITKTTFDEQRAYAFRWTRQDWSGMGQIPCSDPSGCWHELTGAETWSPSLTYLISPDSSHSTIGSATTGTWTFAAKLSKLAHYTSTNMDWNYEVVMQNNALASASRVGQLDLNLYVSITTPTSISFGTISAGQMNASAPDNPYVVTYTGNAILLFQVWGNGDPTNEYGDTLPLSNIYISQNPAPDDTGVKLTTSAQMFMNNLPVALNQNESMYWFVTTPDPFPPGTYAFTYYINIDYQAWAS